MDFMYVAELIAELQNMAPNRKVSDSLIDRLIYRRPSRSSRSLSAIWSWYESNEGVDELADVYGEACGLVHELTEYTRSDDEDIYQWRLAAMWLRDRIGSHIMKKMKLELLEGWRIDKPDESTLRYKLDDFEYEIEKCVGGDYRARVPGGAWRIFPTLERAQVASPRILPPIPTRP